MRFERPTVKTSNDTQLKAAIRRAWGSESAPAALRQRVMNALANEQLLEASVPAAAATEPATTSRSFWQRPAFGWAAAAAAAVLIGFGLARWERARMTSPAIAATSGSTMTMPPKIPTATLPGDLAGALVRTHDRCFRAHPTDHHLFTAAPKDNFPAIAQAMSARLHLPVIATSVGDDWNFLGASICRVGDSKSAHLLYAHDGAAVSVFSLPASVAISGCPDHQNCEAAVGGHPMAGFVENGGFFCVVGSSGAKSRLDAREVKSMRDRLHGQMIAAAANQRAHELLLASMTH